MDYENYFDKAESIDQKKKKDGWDLEK